MHFGSDVSECKMTHRRHVFFCFEGRVGGRVDGDQKSGFTDLKS